MPTEFAEALREIKVARESDVVERALSAAREQLGMDAAYIATVDAREQTIEAMSGRTNSNVLVEGAVLPVDQTYCARMLTGEIPNIVPDTTAARRAGAAIHAGARRNRRHAARPRAGQHGPPREAVRGRAARDLTPARRPTPA